MDILDSQTPEQLRQQVQILQSAIRRAYYCLIDGRRVGDAIKVLKVSNAIDPNMGEPE